MLSKAVTCVSVLSITMAIFVTNAQPVDNNDKEDESGKVTHVLRKFGTRLNVVANPFAR